MLQIALHAQGLNSTLSLKEYRLHALVLHQYSKTECLDYLNSAKKKKKGEKQINAANVTPDQIPKGAALLQ